MGDEDVEFQDAWNFLQAVQARNGFTLDEQQELSEAFDRFSDKSGEASPKLTFFVKARSQERPSFRGFKRPGEVNLRTSRSRICSPTLASRQAPRKRQRLRYQLFRGITVLKDLSPEI